MVVSLDSTKSFLIWQLGFYIIAKLAADDSRV